ncbi:pre-mRNA-splicing factor 3 isoform X2 [Wolffia australiana]
MDKNGSSYEDGAQGRGHRKQQEESRRSGAEGRREGGRDRLRNKDSASDIGRREESRSPEWRQRNSIDRERNGKSRDKDRHHRSSRDASRKDSSRYERSRSYDREMRGSEERGRGSGDESADRRSSKKRKEYEGGNEDASQKRSKALKSPKRETRRNEDRADQDLTSPNGNHNGGKKDHRKMGDTLVEVKDVGEKKDQHLKDRSKEEEYKQIADNREELRTSENVKEEKISGLWDKTIRRQDQATGRRSSPEKMIAGEQQAVVGGDASSTSVATSLAEPSKVSTISTTNEKDGVNVTRSDEVPGKFSADKSDKSVAGKSSSLSLDALAKAKKALQMQRELSEKLKKIPQLSKVASSSAGAKASEEDAPSVSVSGGASDNKSVHAGLPAVPNYEAVKRAQELAARMGFRHDPQFAPLINMFPGATADTSVPQKPSKAPVLRLDALGREIDEQGNVISMAKPTSLSTLKVNINKQKKEAFQILKPELELDAKSHPHFDEGMGINKAKLLRPKRMSFQFVEEGKWSRQAEILRYKSQFGEAHAKELKIKQTQLAKAKAEPDINPNLIEVSERVIKQKQKDPIPDIEWWDRPLLNGSDLNVDKINLYVEHPKPIEPLAEAPPPPPQPLKLTKKEQKKLRTQRRLAKERDRQEMIRQGLIELPKPKVKMSNLMKVLGAEATQDPTKLEMEIRSAAAEREQAHVDRNIARKLTPAERREKKERKLFNAGSGPETVVSVYRVGRLAHPKAQFQVDINAQENRLTGCAVISDAISVVVVEGGKKPNKRYRNLMLKRINWAAAATDEDDAMDTDLGNDETVNRCALVWQGCVARPAFGRFLVHRCRTEAVARKIFADSGVEHYWDLAVNYSDDVI